MAIVPSLPFNLQNGQLADASQVMANFNDILNGVNANAAANGANNDITALLALTTPIGPSTGGGSHDYYGVAATGTANAIVVATTLLPVSGFTLTAGKTLWFMATATNTGATTLNAVGSGATAILKRSSSGLVALTGGEIVTGQLTGVTYDGTQYELIDNPVSAIGVQTALASAATTDLGTVGSHNVLITGTVTITAFGSTALAAFPFYLLGFNGSLLLTHNATSLILPGGVSIQTAAGDFAFAMYLGGGNWRVVDYYVASAGAGGLWPPLFKTGMTLSRASATTFGITTGQCRNEDTGLAFNMNATAAFTKSLSAWAVGSGNGGLDTGAVAATTWYHVHSIRKDSDGSIDYLYSLSVAAPTMPTGYTARRRIGSILTNGSSQITAFIQNGSKFQWDVAVIDRNAVAPGTAAVTVTLTVPTGVVVEADLVVGALAGASTTVNHYVSPLSITDTAPQNSATLSLTGPGTVVSPIQGIWSFAPARVTTNTSGQVRSRCDLSAAASRAGIITNGWIDSFGQ